MKLNEIKHLKEQENFNWELDAEGYFVNVSGVVGWLCNRNIMPEQYTLDPKTLEVELIHQSYVYVLKNSDEDDDKPMAKKLPVRFKSIAGSLDIKMPNLETLRGLPSDIHGSLLLGDATALYKNSFEHWPERVGGSISLPNNTRSLVGISKQLKHIGYTHSPQFNGNKQLFINYERIYEGGLELVEITGLRKTASLNGSEPQFEPFVIIQKYLGQPDKIFECQNELIEADCEEYAKL